MKKMSLVAKGSVLLLTQTLAAQTVLAQTHDEEFEHQIPYYEVSEEKVDHEPSYWSIGLGTALGALVGGPPGAAIGGTLGATFGWGEEQSQLAEKKQAKVISAQEVLSETQETLARTKKELGESEYQLNQSLQRVSSLQKTVDMQSARLSKFELRHFSNDHAEPGELDALKSVVGNYINEIYFHHGEARVPAYAEQRIQKLAELLQAHPKLTVNLRAHTDRTGANEFNEALSESRAASVKQILVNQGIAEERLSINAVGESGANIALGDVPNYVLDRRVAIELSLGGESLSFASVSEGNQ